jgi:hypothetical protein
MNDRSPKKNLAKTHTNSDLRSCRQSALEKSHSSRRGAIRKRTHSRSVTLVEQTCRSLKPVLRWVANEWVPISYTRDPLGRASWLLFFPNHKLCKVLACTQPTLHIIRIYILVDQCNRRLVRLSPVTVSLDENRKGSYEARLALLLTFTQGRFLRLSRRMLDH